MKPEVSVIVPIYNVERYLKKCIDSVLSQTFKEFELILVDDGSPDQCGNIIDEYARNDMRIVAIHQKNSGVSAARNAGIHAAKGEYLSFIDPDDYVDEDFLAKLMDAITESNADIACCGWDSYDETGKIKNKNCLPSGVMSRDEWISHIFDRPRTIMGSSCNKLFRRKCINTQYDAMLKIGEDRMFLVQNSLRIQKAAYIHAPLYHVFERADSATRANPVKLMEGLSVEKKILELMKKEGGKLYRLSEADYLDTALRLYNQFRNSAPATAKIAHKELQKYTKENFFHLMLNREINIKQKVMYLTK